MKFRKNPKIQVSSSGFLLNPVDGSEFWYHGGCKIKNFVAQNTYSKQVTNGFYLSSGTYVPRFFMRMAAIDCLYDTYPKSYFLERKHNYKSKVQDKKTILKLLKGACAISKFKVKSLNFFNADQLTPNLAQMFLECIESKGGHTHYFAELVETYYFQFFQKNPALLECIKEMGYDGWFESEGSIRSGNDLNLAVLDAPYACVYAGELDFENVLSTAEMDELYSATKTFLMAQLGLLVFDI